MEIRVLARQGHGIKKIARELGLSRNTVRKYLRGETVAPRYKARSPRACKLDPFTAYLQERIDAARPKWIPATVLLREIQEHGYTGGISQLKRYLAPFKHHAPDPVVRFETPPGKQLQVDFTTIRRGREPLKAFVATLGYSRATYVRFFDREDSDAWLTGLREAFVYFGGVPAEALFDNAAAIISERDAYGEGLHRWHPRLAALADEYGFRPRVCRPYRAKTKGKVERFNGYLKGSFVTPLAATLKTAGLKLELLRPMRISATGWRTWPISAFTAPPVTSQQSDWLKSSMSCCLCPKSPTQRAQRLRCVPVGHYRMTACNIRSRYTTSFWRCEHEPATRAHRRALHQPEARPDRYGLATPGSAGRVG